MGTLNGKVAIITGAGTGLGRELARLFVQEGAKISICGRREDKIRAVQEGLHDYKENVIALTADVSVEQDAARVIQLSKERFGRIDILINNAAVYENSSILETSLESWDYHFKNNVTSTFLMCRGAIPIMRAQREGQIINMTSSLAVTGGDGFAAYSASKAAIQTLSYSLDDEERRNGILVSVVNPGVMKSNMQALGGDPKRVARNFLDFVRIQKPTGSQVVQLDDPYQVEYTI